MNTRHRGFTLIEVLVALAILALSLVAVIGAAGSSTRLSSGLRDRTFADWVALNELTTLRLARTAPSDSSLNGDADMGDQKWHWTAKISPTADPNLLRIDVDVGNAAKPDEIVQSVTVFMGTNQSTGGAPP
ncbi:MAG TPA: type II secretion system minor pseudopilin GspI [Gammaproteobacteria bacterium]|nr:type II secretion system minor pseudopilin GspI [Gammaproteobacteria bacterium]